jgi:hypothetical protein
MDPAPKRPWYRLYWLTWLLLLAFAFIFVMRQRTERLSHVAVGASQLWKSSTFGWPLVDLDVKETVNLGVTGARQRSTLGD